MESRCAHRRLPTWDYSQTGLYFTTFCTHARKPLLGRIEATPDALGLNARFVASDLGSACMEIAHSVHLSHPHAFFEKLTLMPDHVHALIALHDVAEDDALDLGKVIFSFKKKATVQGRHLGIEGKLWQSNYHDHIVRNEQDALRIMEYMDENPLKWALGKHDPQEEISVSFLDG